MTRAVEDCFEFLKVKRLDQMMVEAGVSRPAAVVVLTVPRDRNQQHVAVTLGLAEPTSHLISIHSRQTNVEEDNVGSLRPRGLKGIKPVVSDARGMTR